jgi:PIN domain nuclease of toxin-antitoxin system
MRFLVDTHALLWALGEPSALSPAARDAIADPSNLIVVSNASLWECAIKASIGKLDRVVPAIVRGSGSSKHYDVR